ncbi:hypothetical protein L6164_026043 [Bauhinia variegata]|uniref:Uncharacterized protein n=1 Tax=Bauhinia variegata TaxID=167791 RepID=A0ACB9M264_BAUVA|nr:hypothetical protein L6164_026043 [Bauhinia variegata]
MKLLFLVRSVLHQSDQVCHFSSEQILIHTSMSILPLMLLRVEKEKVTMQNHFRVTPEVAPLTAQLHMSSKKTKYFLKTVVHCEEIMLFNVSRRYITASYNNSRIRETSYTTSSLNAEAL